MKTEVREWLTIATGSLFVLLFGGINFGFMALIKILAADNIFRSQCRDAVTDPIPCVEQSILYNAMFVSGVFAFNFSAWPLGFACSRFGARNVGYGSSLLLFISCLMLVFVLPRSFFYLSTTAFVFLSIGGRGVFLASISYVSRPLHIILISAANDMACSVFSVWYELHEIGVSLVSLFAAFALLSLFLCPLVYFIWPDNRPFVQAIVVDEFEENEEEHDYLSNSIRSPCSTDRLTSGENGDVKYMSVHPDEELSNHIDDSCLVEAEHPTFRQQALSVHFLVMSLVFSFGALVINMYIPSAEKLIMEVTHSEGDSSSYVKMMGIGLVAGGLIAIPLFTFIEEKGSPVIGSYFSFIIQFLFSVSLFIGLYLGQLHTSTVSRPLTLPEDISFTGMTIATYELVSSSHLSSITTTLSTHQIWGKILLYVGLFSACLFRPFMFALRGDLLIFLFGKEHFPQLLGLLTTIVAFFGLTQYLLYPLGINHSWVIVTGILSCLSLLCLIYPPFLQKTYKNKAWTTTRQ
eukprot:Awhi_evm1s3139